MSELFDLGALSGEAPVTDSTSRPMTPEQREEIRTIFGELGIRTAREQFDLVDVLIGIRLRSVAELTAINASTLLPRLKKRLESRSKKSTGNSWDDRDEDTWIDNL